MLSDRCPVCLSVLSVMLVYCGQTAGWINMPLSIEIGLLPGDFVLDGDPVVHQTDTAPIFGHVYCSQTVSISAIGYC